MCGTSTNGFCPLKFSLLSSRRFENRRFEVEKERFSVGDLNKKNAVSRGKFFNGNYEIALEIRESNVIQTSRRPSLSGWFCNKEHRLLIMHM